MIIQTAVTYGLNIPKRTTPIMSINWSLYPNFSEQEFKCSESGLCKMNPNFLSALQKLRTEFGRPLKISSGYRAETHSSEAFKSAPGTHTAGLAADILVSHKLAHDLLTLALTLKLFTGIGIKQKGPAQGRFIHLDIADKENFKSNIIRPTVWSY